MLFQWKPRAKSVEAAEARFTRAVQVIAATQGGDTVLLDPVHGRYHTLNEVGSRVWNLLEGGTTLRSIVRVIEEEYSLPPDPAPNQIEQDITRLLASLRAAGLVSVLSSVHTTEK